MLALARLKLHIAILPNFWDIQSAYGAAHSTETTLVKIIDDILQSVDAGSIVALVGLGISAAFDMVNHATLLAMLQSEFGVTDTRLINHHKYADDTQYYTEGRSERQHTAMHRCRHSLNGLESTQAESIQD